MPVYSIDYCNPDALEKGAVILEDDVPVLRTIHRDDWEAGDHDGMAEHAASCLTLLGAAGHSEPQPECIVEKLPPGSRYADGAGRRKRTYDLADV
ncbi:MAG: hypothetical protein GC149_20485 [Gammaproteobacteria bacterium]|nr:hypothetical protein [Gammaproteobacteria bacterium]